MNFVTWRGKTLNQSPWSALAEPFRSAQDSSSFKVPGSVQEENREGPTSAACRDSVEQETQHKKPQVPGVYLNLR